MSFQFTAASNTDETILESYLESLSTSSFPNEIRRVLEHLRYLNSEVEVDVERWREGQDRVLEEIKQGVLQFRHDFVHNSDEAADEVISAADGRKRSRDDDGSDADRSNKKADVDQDAAVDQSSVRSAVPSQRVPTNEQVISYLASNNPHLFDQQEQISEQYARLKQLSAQRIETAHQLRNMIDMALGRLDRDLMDFEQELGISHASTEVNAGASVSTSTLSTAACTALATQPPPAARARTPLTSAPVIDQSALQSSDKLDNKLNKNQKSILRRASTTTSTSSATTPNPALLSRSNSVALPISPSAGTFAQRPKDLAAIQVTPNSVDWILAKILSFDKSTKVYTLSDEDIAEEKIYTIPSNRVIPLNKTLQFKRGDIIYAVYPDTTSFYSATVSSYKGNFVMVHFRDDSDEFGVTHEKAVPVWLAMKVPGKQQS